MNDEHTPADLEPIEFESPGRFTLHLSLIHI